MRVVVLSHSLISDWNHGNAHFLRGVATELQERGHEVNIYEPRNAWSVENLLKEHGAAAISDFERAYPHLSSIRYDPASLDLDAVLKDANLVLVHEWNDHDLVRRIGKHRQSGGNYRLLFHDTHHRMVTEPEAMAAYDLSGYDGVLAFGNVIRGLYLKRRWARRAWTWHEAADTRVFRPLYGEVNEGDLVWIGNWGDEERTAELHEFLLNPVRTLGLRAKVYGVRYPEHALDALKQAGIEYGGWLPNFRVPEIFARYKVTVHVPRRPYVQNLPGIPTIRPFEALACGIPLVCSPWNDSENLFQPGRDFLTVRNGEEMTRALWSLLNSEERRRDLALHGRETILARHTCGHRAEQLIEIYQELRKPRTFSVATRNGASANGNGHKAADPSLARHLAPIAAGALAVGAIAAVRRRAVRTERPEESAAED